MFIHFIESLVLLFYDSVPELVIRKAELKYQRAESQPRAAFSAHVELWRPCEIACVVQKLQQAH